MSFSQNEKDRAMEQWKIENRLKTRRHCGLFSIVLFSDVFN